VGEPLHVFKLPRGRRDSRRIMLVLDALPPEKDYELTLCEKKRTRSLSQNRLLWSLYQQIIDRGGEAMQGWERDDLHEFFLIEHFGGEPKQLFERFRIQPLQRSSSLSKQDFSDFVEHIVRFMAQRGVALDLPDGDWR
jgi:hypothetical protein